MSHDYEIVRATSHQKYIFNIHQITTLGGKFSIFQVTAWTTKRTEFTKTPFQVKNSFFSGMGLASQVGRGTAFPHLLVPTKPGSALHVSQNSSQIYASEVGV